MPPPPNAALADLATDTDRRPRHRGRAVVAERQADGTERRTDNVMNMTDGTQFDREWAANPGASAITQQRAATHALPQHTRGALGHRQQQSQELSASDRELLRQAPAPRPEPNSRPSAIPPPPRTRTHPSASSLTRVVAAPASTLGARRPAAQGKANYEQQRDRMLEEARQERARAPPHASSRQREPPIALQYAGGASAGARGGRGYPPGSSRDAQLASQLASQEARRAGLY